MPRDLPVLHGADHGRFCDVCGPLVEAGDADGLARRALDNFVRLQDATGLDGPALLVRLRELLGPVTPS